MTGFGKAETIAAGKKLTVEIRSLNSKQLDLSVKMPPAYRTLDTEIRSMASKILQRGKVDIFVNIEAVSAATEVSINKELFSEYYKELGRVSVENEIAWGSDIVSAHVIPAILRLPDVVNNNADNVPEEEAEALYTAVAGALEQLDSFRASEGATLIADLVGRVGKIEKYREDIVPYEKERTEAIKKRIRENVEAVGVPIDPNRLEQEIVFYVEKLDITEEKVRLTNHCEYFREVAASEENAGRKLGFITQEMGREINTIGSKANDAAIQRIVVNMKDELEKIKEQLLNIL